MYILGLFYNSNIGWNLHSYNIFNALWIWTKQAKILTEIGFYMEIEKLIVFWSEWMLALKIWWIFVSVQTIRIILASLINKFHKYFFDRKIIFFCSVWKNEPLFTKITNQIDEIIIDCWFNKG